MNERIVVVFIFFPIMLVLIMLCRRNTLIVLEDDDLLIRRKKIFSDVKEIRIPYKNIKGMRVSKVIMANTLIIDLGVGQEAFALAEIKNINELSLLAEKIGVSGFNL
jgi:hypothetical protein